MTHLTTPKYMHLLLLFYFDTGDIFWVYTLLMQRNQESTLKMHIKNHKTDIDVLKHCPSPL